MKGHTTEIIPIDSEGAIHQGLRILARLIAREAVNVRLAKCGAASHSDKIEHDFQNANPVERAAGM